MKAKNSQSAKLVVIFFALVVLAVVFKKTALYAPQTKLPTHEGSRDDSSEFLSDSKNEVTEKVEISLEDKTSNLSKIGYELPSNWIAETVKNSADEMVLFLRPKSEGGFLSIKEYEVQSVNEIENYCQISGVCIDGTSSFEEVKIGNVMGYKASAIDTSGGGSEYFLIKGQRLYIVASYNPPSPNNFEGSFQEVIDSLVF